MRGTDKQTAALFSYLSPEAMVPPHHPLRRIRPLANAALERLSPSFDRIYAAGGRDSIAPEKLLRALLLQAFYSVRSERQLMEREELGTNGLWAAVGTSCTTGRLFQAPCLRSGCAGPSHALRRLARKIHEGWRAWRKPLIGNRIRLRPQNPAVSGAHARQG